MSEHAQALREFDASLNNGTSVRDRLASGGGRKVHKVHVEAYGQLFIREMTVAESMALAKAEDAGDDNEAQIRRSLEVVANALVEEDRVTPVFDDINEGVEILMGQSISAAKDLIDATVKVNGLSEEAVKADVGNSDAAPS